MRSRTLALLALAAALAVARAQSESSQTAPIIDDFGSEQSVPMPEGTHYENLHGKRPTYKEAVELCAAKQQQLCSAKALCPDGPGTRPLGPVPAPTVSAWAPVSDAENEWLFIAGPAAKTQDLCRNYSSLHSGKRPDWGVTQTGQLVHVRCCAVSLESSESAAASESSTSASAAAAPQPQPQPQPQSPMKPPFPPSETLQQVRDRCQKEQQTVHYLLLRRGQSPQEYRTKEELLEALKREQELEERRAEAEEILYRARCKAREMESKLKKRETQEQEAKLVRQRALIKKLRKLVAAKKAAEERNKRQLAAKKKKAAEAAKKRKLQHKKKQHKKKSSK
jgi:hypothetical protein